MSITAAERVAILTAIQAGVTAELGRAKADALAVAHTVGVKAFTTPWGAVNVMRAEPKVRFDEDALVAWALEHAPTEVQTRRFIRTSYQAALVKRLAIAGDDVIDTTTGEAVPYATVTHTGDDYLSFPASSLQKAAKSDAIAWVRANADQLVQGLTAVEATP